MSCTVGVYIAAGKRCILAAESVDTVEAAADTIELESTVQLEDTAVPGCTVPVVGKVVVGGTAELVADIAEAEFEDTVQDIDGFVDTVAADTAEVAADIAEAAEIVEAVGNVELLDTAEPADFPKTIE